MTSRMQKSETQQSEMQTLRAEEPAKLERLYYLDWLRVIAVFGVFLSHTGDIFDTLYWHTRQHAFSYGRLIPDIKGGLISKPGI